MSCIPFTKEEAQALVELARLQQAERAERLPDVETALTVMTQAWHRLRELGWREAMYCPKDGSMFEVIEAGSSGIHVAYYHGEWPNGWWIADEGDSWPSHPILWRPITEQRRRGGTP